MHAKYYTHIRETEILKNPGLPDVTDMAACAPFASGCVLHRDLLALKCG